MFVLCGDRTRLLRSKRVFDNYVNSAIELAYRITDNRPGLSDRSLSQKWPLVAFYNIHGRKRDVQLFCM
jgi:hypothetical protein